MVAKYVERQKGAINDMMRLCIDPCSYLLNEIINELCKRLVFRGTYAY